MVDAPLNFTYRWLCWSKATPARCRTSWCDSVRETPLIPKVKTTCSIVEPWPDSDHARDELTLLRGVDPAVHARGP